MEQILSKLLVANSNIIQEGTKELKNAFKNPDAIPQLCDVITNSPNPQVRQIAAVVLRRKFSKKRIWEKLDVQMRNRVKEGIIRILIAENEKPVKNSIAQLLGLLGKYELSENSWPELLQFIYTMCSSANDFDKEMGMYTLSIMTEISQGSYINEAPNLAVLFTNVLNSLSDLKSNLAYYTVMTMNNLVSVIGGHQQMINVYQSLLPRILEIVDAFLLVDEKKCVDILGILEELIEYAIAVVVPHLKTVTNMCLQIGSNSSLPTSVQIKAISVIGWLIRFKGKVIQKHNLVEPIIKVLLQVMAQKPNNDDEEYFIGDPDESTAITVATQTLDLIALNIPASKVINFILTEIEPALQSDNVYAQKAAFLCLAVLAEGCSECIRNKYLETFLKCVCIAIQNQNLDSVVRNAAFFALGQFAEHLQPEISKYASDLLPVLLDYLNQLYIHMETDKTEPKSLGKLFYALESFCENLDDELLPYLPLLMEKLLQGLNPHSWSMQLKRVALSTVGSATRAVKSGMLPYFPKIMEILNIFINCDPESENHELLSDAIDCLAVVAEFIGADHFKPLAQNTLQLSMGILKNTEDPDIKRSVYALLGALAGIMKDEISSSLPTIIEHMIVSLQSSDGIVSYSDDDKPEEYDIYKELSSDEEDIGDEDMCSTDSDESSQCRYSVENAYIDEKEQACLTLREICQHTGQAFLPYMEKSFEEIFKMMDYPQESIRKVAIDALLQFCITLYKINTNETKQALYKTLQVFIPKCSELIRADEEKSVVIGGLDAYTELLKEIKGDIFAVKEHREAIMNCVIDVLTHKTMCQDTDVTVVNGLESIQESTEAEQDELLLESACDVIPKYGQAIKSSEFVLYFPNILRLLTVRTVKDSISQRSFAYGTLAECMKCLGTYVDSFVPSLVQIWFSGAKDASDEVRNNAIFGVGEMVLHGKEKVFEYHKEILQALSFVVSKESHAGTLDNICGAVAKIIISNSNAVPLDQIFPNLLQHLPLRTDFEENESVANCFLLLYQKGDTTLRQHMEKVLQVLIHIYNRNQTPNDETKVIVIHLLKLIHKDFTNEFNAVASQLDDKDTEILRGVFNQ